MRFGGLVVKWLDSISDKNKITSKIFVIGNKSAAPERFF